MERKHHGSPAGTSTRPELSYAWNREEAHTYQGRDQPLCPKCVSVLAPKAPKFPKMSPEALWLRAVSASLHFASCSAQPLTRVTALRALARKQAAAPVSVQTGAGPAGEWWKVFQFFGAEFWDCEILGALANITKK
eukprot:9503549-Pyramimonas_sp.AAC.1